jgi:CheY-like chemotaxis protein
MNFPTVPIEEVPLPPPLAEATTNRPLVLIVDSDSAAADSLAETLSQHGFAAVAAYNGPQAIETVLLMPPELLIADVQLPGTTGIELASAVKDVFPECEAILLSAQDSLQQLPESARRDWDQFVVLNKPVRAVDLLAQVAESFKSTN